MSKSNLEQFQEAARVIVFKLGLETIDPQEALQALTAAATSLVEAVIGEDDSYSDMCEKCNDWDDGRNALRASQRAKLKEQTQ